MRPHNSLAQIVTICPIASRERLVIPPGLGLAVNFYATAQFYDCNAREQLQQDGLTTQCKLREGTDGSLEGENLCDEGAATEVQLLSALITEGESDDLTRFVSWTMDPNDPQSSDVEGQMINKYLQSDRGRTKTRVNLSRVSGKKAVDVTLLFHDPNGDPAFLLRVYFEEDGSGNAVTDNYIVARYWSADYGKVLVTKAHLNPLRVPPSLPTPAL